MSAYYDLFEKPDVNKTGKQQPLYARFIPKGTIEQKEFLNRVHLFTGISRSLLEGAMSAFMDELRDCLADGWTVELGELGYFTPSLSCQREVMEKKELRAASVRLRGLNFRVSKEFYKELDKKDAVGAPSTVSVQIRIFCTTSFCGTAFPFARRVFATVSLYQPCTVCPPDGAQCEAGGYGFELVY